MTTDTTDPTELGGEGGQNAPEPEPQLSERELICQRLEAEQLKEMGIDPPEPPEETLPEPEPIPEPSKTEPVKVKIDGVEEEKTLEELVRHYQKSESGDRKLQQAALMQQQLEQERQLLEEDRQRARQEHAAMLEEQKLLASAKAVEPPEPEEPSELEAKALEALEYGDYAEYLKLQKQMLAPQASQPSQEIDVAGIAQQAAKEARLQIEYENAEKNFFDANKHLQSDEILYRLTVSTFNTMCAESKSYQEAFEKTGKAMSDWIGSVSPQPQPAAITVDTAMTDRQAKKDSIQAEPGRANARSAPPPATKEETASEIISNMRKARGLPV